jgi:hypothetical protein
MTITKIRLEKKPFKNPAHYVNCINEEDSELTCDSFHSLYKDKHYILIHSRYEGGIKSKEGYIGVAHKTHEANRRLYDKAKQLAERFSEKYSIPLEETCKLEQTTPLASQDNPRFRSQMEVVCTEIVPARLRGEDPFADGKDLLRDARERS